ncbi:efflux RND transporter periplasmic adaptor subunit [Kineobactrum salinum]|uniref:Efflux RND transporter periplasmic adaptor subunit n=1 Tax=Kineobactrum salinum TaxID=2708301 RepID=A0A6C0U4P6_9GAMM|nr:efflux RND transporter periplasmic adaptor subunit [Kineobactrum salinum]QIB64424.1 efflux RND transporter periplasmic adaptor subunit [Kineobactrum salinum]
MFKTQIKPLWTAGGLVVLLVLWLASGDILRAPDRAPEASEPSASALNRVQVREFRSQAHQPLLSVQGQVQAWQQVEMIARVGGEVMNLPVRQGSRVEKGTVLVELDAEDREARVAQLEADLALVEAELEATEKLGARDLTSQIEQLDAVAERARVRAELEAVKLALRNTRPTAPFDGFFDRRFVDEGDYVEPGQRLLRFADISRVRVSAQIPQQDVHKLEVGYPAAITLFDHHRLEGELSYIAAVADPETRSYYIEIEAENPDLRRIAGGSASIRIRLAQEQAHRISLSLLSLDGDGRMVVRYVDDEQRVHEQPVELLSTNREGAWVAGLPDRVKLITQGAGFVELGQEVEAVMAGEE